MNLHRKRVLNIKRFVLLELFPQVLTELYQCEPALRSHTLFLLSCFQIMAVLLPLEATSFLTHPFLGLESFPQASCTQCPTFVDAVLPHLILTTFTDIPRNQCPKEVFPNLIQDFCKFSAVSNLSFL